MSRRWTLCLTFVLIAALAPVIAADEAPGTLEWKAHNGMYNAHGSFKTWRFTRIDVPDGELENGSVEFEVELASVWEKAADLAEHLRQADFFDVAKFTTATVKVDRAKKTGDDTYEAIATVSLHGQTGEVPVEFKIVGTSPLQVEGTATLSRAAFGIGQPYEEGNDRSIVDGVSIMLNATLTE